MSSSNGRKPRKGDTVRLQWHPEVPIEQRGKTVVIVVNDRSQVTPYYVDHESIAEGDEYWGPYGPSHIKVLG